ncbi:IPExxxVDY family protein [Elizabethkingia meningoseptica]|uniref:IPExxxVDY family protein n=1 Tax=Elizabethkingia meningoseptica TaxID=238 RepID=UPI0023AFE19B|nr:IPExxxVDY family protein [Elizabethkingia meningoseptica]MDE5439287.1 IPExxxVDY family protein [Elizabethkingia meningoseptica]MDE5510073.1 IPExxxVDY family protein [Elizabethkingia meningoseptica]MDE5517023.1 IPExxxVDY family protein [Elizabethkingia meningoseptica]MDE5527628.1 IPExxxVDY family protein [Elizabethkingia meningoseptica]MDE5531263.1 IPExxxVDY family protein [Elizabethkingia meningoseptica]
MAKVKKIRLDFDDDEPITVGLIRLTKPVPYHQFFFEINRKNEFQFRRTEDFITQHGLTQYEFLSMQGYDKGEKNCYQIIANKSFKKEENTPSNLFEGLQEIHYLLEDLQDVDFLIKTQDSYPDFSLILFPENIIFPIQEYQIQPEELIYQYIQEYE